MAAARPARDGGACAAARFLRAADRGPPRVRDRGADRPGRDGCDRRAARAPGDRGSRSVRAGGPAGTRAPCASRGSPCPHLPGGGARAPADGADRCRRGAARARARAWPVVRRSRLHGRPGPAGAWPRGRPRARQALRGTVGPLGRGLGDRRAARAVRRMAGTGERLPDGRVLPGTDPGRHTLPACRPTVAGWRCWERGRSASR